MIRVTVTAAEGDLTTLRVEGSLTQQTAEELRMACEAALTEHPALHLELSGLQFVDATGAALLHDLERRGASLAGCSGFVAAVLAEPRGGTPTDVSPAEAAPESAERALLERLRRGDATAFDALVREHAGRMLAVARRLVGAEDEARDVVQEAFIAVFRAIDTFAGNSRLGTWLHRIVVNAALMKLRSRRRRREEQIENLLPRFDDEGYWVDAPGDWETATETVLARQETRVRVRQAIDRLPLAYRTVLLLRDIEELDTDETASLLSVTPNTVKTRLHRARQALRTLLEGELPGASTDEPALARAAQRTA